MILTSAAAASFSLDNLQSLNTSDVQPQSSGETTRAELHLQTRQPRALPVFLLLHLGDRGYLSLLLGRSFEVSTRLTMDYDPMDTEATGPTVKITSVR